MKKSTKSSKNTAKNPSKISKKSTSVNKNAVKIQKKAGKHQYNDPLTLELIQYCKNIIKNKPLSCKKHKDACKRFLNDLNKQGSKNFPYIFDPERAERFFRFVRLFKHHQGILAGKQIDPDITIKFIFGNIYGWIHKTTEYRRFQKVYWQVARKNAKSQMLAIVGLYELMAFEENQTQEVYCAATKRDQAKIVFNEACSLLRKSDAFKNSSKYNITYNSIVHYKSGSVMKTMSKEDKKFGDGYKPQCGIVDEYHAHEDSKILDVLDSAMGFKSQPLLIIITTAGFDLYNPCFQVEYDLASKIVDPENPVEIETYFVMINEIEYDPETGELKDDIKNPKVWIKANPIVCSYKEGRAYLKNKLDEAVVKTEKMRNFLTKHMNVWVQMKEMGYMLLSKWNNCKNEFPDLTKESAYVGLDLSAKHDLTSVGIEFKINEIYYVKSHSFIPEERIQNKIDTDKVPYNKWIDEGWLSLTPGAVTEYKFIMDWVIEEASKNTWIIEEWCVDPWHAAQISSDLIELGHTVVDITQGIKTLSEPTKDFRNMVLEKKVVHDGNPLLAWSISNAVVDEVDRNKNIILNKKKSKERIDPIAALINAHVRCMLDIEPGYNKRGMRSLS